MPAADLLEALQAIHVRHAHVEHDEIRPGLPDERQDLGAVLGLADDLEPAVVLERAADAVEHEAMVVCEQNLHAGSLARAVDVTLPRTGACYPLRVTRTRHCLPPKGHYRRGKS